MKALFTLLLFASAAQAKSSSGLVLSGVVAPSVDVHVVYDSSLREWTVRQTANLPGVVVKMARAGATPLVTIAAP